MNDKPFVSIIIPFYNTPEKFFKRCVNSLLTQTNGNFEVLIINDGSKKEYVQILKETVNADKRIRLLNKVNEGAAIARNIGIAEARGEYIMFLDSDDVITDYCLEEAVEIITAYHPDLVIGAVKRVTDDEFDGLRPAKNAELRLLHVASDNERDLLMSHIIGDTDLSFLLRTGYIADGPVAKVVRKTIVEKALFPKEPFWNEDTIWNLNMLKQCNRIAIVDDLWYLYIIHSSSSVHKFRPNCPFEFEFRINQELDLVKKLWPNCTESIYCRIFNDITILGKTFLFHPDNSISWAQRYKVYKESIHKEAFREALKGLTLKREKRIIHKTGKELLRFTAYYGPHIISYWILEMFYKINKYKL